MKQWLQFEGSALGCRYGLMLYKDFLIVFFEFLFKMRMIFFSNDDYSVASMRPCIKLSEYCKFRSVSGVYLQHNKVYMALREERS